MHDSDKAALAAPADGVLAYARRLGDFGPPAPNSAGPAPERGVLDFLAAKAFDQLGPLTAVVSQNGKRHGHSYTVTFKTTTASGVGHDVAEFHTTDRFHAELVAQLTPERVRSLLVQM